VSATCSGPHSRSFAAAHPRRGAAGHGEHSQGRSCQGGKQTGRAAPSQWLRRLRRGAFPFKALGKKSALNGAAAGRDNTRPDGWLCPKPTKSPAQGRASSAAAVSLTSLSTSAASVPRKVLTFISGLRAKKSPDEHARRGWRHARSAAEQAYHEISPRARGRPYSTADVVDPRAPAIARYQSAMR
jgi:hypothetical protein